MAGSKEKNEQKPRRKPGRVPTSCAECRRLKLRCDRNVPCEKCVSRGCGSICPDGSLTSGKGNRLVLANTEELHDRIDNLCARIRELEDALRLLQSSVSNEPHPLLCEDRLFISKASPPQASTSSSTTLPSPVPSSYCSHSQQPPPPPTVPRPVASSQIQESPIHPEPLALHPNDGSEEDNIIDAFGTLTISHRGESSFLGQTARSEYLIRALAKPRPPLGETQPRLPSRIVEATNYCPELETTADENLRQDIIRHLPPRAEALRLCEIYLEYSSLLISPVTASEVHDDILNVACSSEPLSSVQSSHAISLLFAILAIGSLFDPARPPFGADAHEYYILARATLTMHSPIIHTTLTAIQALMHCSQYIELSESESVASNSSWMSIAFAARLGQSIGLHLNSARWNLPPDVIQRRSRIFWQLLSLDTWMSFGLGRPPMLTAPYIDCEFPKDTEECVNDLGNPEIGFHPWCWRYTSLLQSVIATAFVPKLPRYATVLELDRKVRDFHVPIRLRPECKDGIPVANIPQVLQMQRWFVLACKETTLLNLHRGYFAQALHEQPTDIIKHKYGPSVLATYRSAWRLIESTRMFWRLVPHLISRASLAWSQGLSAAIVMCLLATRAPTSSFTRSALESLDNLVSAFEEASSSSRCARDNLNAIRMLRDKARTPLDRSHAPEVPTITPAELDRLGGKTHLIAAAPPPVQPSIYQAPLSDPPPELFSGMNMSGNSNGDVSMAANMHPTIAADMRNLDVGMPLFNEIFDLPTEPLSQSMQSVPMALENVPSFLDSDFGGTSTVSNSVKGPSFSMYQPSPSPFSDTPVLWQSFIEQLGF